MAYRVRFTLIWSVQRDMVPGAWNKTEDFLAHATRELGERFANYKSAVAFEVEEFSRISKITITWDVNLDSARGAWHRPQDHLDYAEFHLFKAMGGYALDLVASPVQRHVDPDFLLDQGRTESFVPWSDTISDDVLAAWLEDDRREAAVA